MSQNGMDTGSRGYWLIILLLSTFIVVLGAGTASALLPARADTAQEAAGPEESIGTADAADADHAEARQTAAAEDDPAVEAESEPETSLNHAVQAVSDAAGTAQDALEEAERRRRAGDWRLILVNPEHKAPEGYTVELATVDRGYQVDARCAEELTQMLVDCRSAGHDPIICSAFREHSYQEQLFQNSIWNFRSRGYSEAEAIELTSQELAVPGTSEHELGLAVDIVSRSHQILDKAQENTGTQKWLMENSWKYGFVLRYPTDRTDITGIIYEPWHYRYVGKEYAKEMYEKDLCLEEYLAE